MTTALASIITELRAGAELSAEGAGALQWRKKIASLKPVSVASHGAGLSMVAAAARTLLLQRGQVGAMSDVALRGVLIEIANILELELRAQDGARRNRQAQRREVPHYLRDGA